MPELPELETFRRELEKEATGKRIKTVEITGNKVTRRHGTNKKAMIARLEGAKVKGVDRRGRHLVAPLDTGDVLVFDLGETGQLSKAAPRDVAPKHTHVVLSFTQGGAIRFIDPKGEGEVFVAASDTLAEEVPEINQGGLDPVAEPISWTTFARLLLSRNTKLKAVLMDPTVVVAIGPIYSDEILFAAGLRYDRSSESLSSQEIRRLYRGLVETLHEAVKHRGSTVGEHPFMDLYGKPGDYQDELKVYAREGEACRRCRSPIVKARFSNRMTYFCEQCQV
jgi:formamidopyrimidine-DNA glycosylase